MDAQYWSWARCTEEENNQIKKNKVEKKPAAIPQSQEPVRGQQEHDEEKIIQSLLGHENAEDAVIQHFEETEEKIIANLAKGYNSDMERWMQTYMELSRLDDERGSRNLMESDNRLMQGERAKGDNQPQHKSSVWQQTRCKKREAGRIFFFENARSARRRVERTEQWVGSSGV